MNYEQIAVGSQVVSAIAFVIAMVVIWIKFIAPAVQAAQVAHNKQIAEAERHRDEARASLEALRLEIEGARRDAEMIRGRAKEQAVREAEALVAEAREANERTLRNAQGELERSRLAARDQLRTELLEKALVRARTEAAARVDGPLNARIVQSFVSALHAGAEN